MLQSIHNATKSWFGYIVLTAITLFLVGAFALWGVNDIFRGGVDTSVATVGGQDIQQTEYDRELKAQIRQLSQGQTEIPMDQVRALGLDKMVLDQMIARQAVDERVAALGLTASDEAVRARIQRDQNFQGTDGSFDRGKFERLLSMAQIDEAQYVGGMRGDLAREEYILAAVGGVAAPPRLGRLIYDYVSEQRLAEYFVLTPDSAGNPPEPTEAQLVAYHKAHAAEFSTPEYREVQYVEIGVAEVAGDIQISDADLKTAWDQHQEEFQKPEQREIEQIGFPTQAAAQAAYAKIQSGTPFLTVAHDAGKSDADIKLGTFTKSGLDARLAGPAFALAEGAVSAPVQGPFGWALLRVAHITAGETKTFEQMRDTLRQALIKDRAAQRIADVTNKFEDERGGDKQFAEAAAGAGVQVRHVTIDNKGLAPDGSKPAIPAAPEFLQQVFATEAGNESEIFESAADHTQFAIKVISVRAPALKPLDSVRAQVRDAWLAEQRAKLLLARTEALTAQMQHEGGIAGAARAAGKTPATSPALTRSTAGDIFSADALSKIFSSPPGTAIYARVGKGDGYVLARVVKVQHPQPAAEALIAARGEVSRQLSGDVGQTLAQAARADAGVEIHQQVLNTVLGQSQ